MSSINIYGAFPTTTIGPFHYLYRITNLVENKHYYGIRTSKKLLPQQDLGRKYYSSSCDKGFIQDQKDHPENYRYKIIIVAYSRKLVADLEIKLHQKFNVSANPKFYNLANHTSSNFNIFGRVSVRDIYGNTSSVSVNDEKFLDGTLKSIMSGKVSVKDNEGNHFHVSNTAPEFLNGTLISTSTGMVSVKDGAGNFLRVSKTDERYLNGSLVSIATGRINVKDSSGRCFGVAVDDPRVKNGELKHHSSGTLTVKDEFGNTFVTSVDNPLYLNGTLKYVNPAFKYYKQTPWGIFESLKDIGSEINCDTVHKWCKNNERPVNKFSYNHCKKLQETFGPDCIGKTYKELGFCLLTPKEYQELVVINFNSEKF